MRPFEDDRVFIHPSSSPRLILPTLRNIVGEDKKQAVGGKLRSIKRSSAVSVTEDTRRLFGRR